MSGTGILPFGTSTNSPTISLAPIKAFGCTVVDFNVSADWSSQAGNLSFRLIEDEVSSDRLTIPVLGSPFNFEMKTTGGEVLHQYVGLVESFSRSASTSKTYSVNLTSPLTILDSAQVILDGFLGLGGSQEGYMTSGVGGLQNYDFGTRNNLMDISENPGINHWWNVSNLINVFGLLENDDPAYTTPFAWDSLGTPTLHGDFGFSSNSEDGMPLAKLMYGLHLGVNHLPKINQQQKQRTHGGNLLFGRHNYNVGSESEGIPYYYHFDALGFYNQVSGVLGPQFRIAGKSKSIREIVTEVCSEANLEYYAYIDTYTDTTIGSPTLQEVDPNWSLPANCSWTGLNTSKFTNGGNYGGTIRIRTINKNVFSNTSRPFSNIAYNIIGLEVPDLKDGYWDTSGVHPGKRPVNDMTYGIPVSNTYYSDPLDSNGITSVNNGFTEVGTRTVVNGGNFPNTTGYWDSGKFNDVKVSQSDVSIKLNDLVTMKVVTGGYQTRIVSVPRSYLKQYWGDIILPNSSDPRETANTATDPLGLNETSSRKIPVVTPILDPRDVDDFILIDMQDVFGDLSIPGVLSHGIYAASLFEVRLAMQSKYSWDSFITKYKYDKVRGLVSYFYPNCIKTTNADGSTSEDRNKSAELVNNVGGIGYAGLCEMLGVGNVWTAATTAVANIAESLTTEQEPVSGGVGDSTAISCSLAYANIQFMILPSLYEKVKTIGETHYGKSWYVPVPYFNTKEDLDGNNLVGNFKRSWELADSAYVEPSTYYDNNIPQTNQFIQDGKVHPFVNYDHNFLTGSGNQFKEQYATSLTNLVNGKNNTVFNFSEYDINSLAITKYWDSGAFPLSRSSGTYSIIHAEPVSIGDRYSFIPYGYEYYYDRTAVPFSDIITGKRKKYSTAMVSNQMGPTTIGQIGHQAFTTFLGIINKTPDSNNAPSDATSNPGAFTYESKMGIPSKTYNNWLVSAVSGVVNLDYADNGRFCLPYVKVETHRVFLPQTKPGLLTGNGMGDINSSDAFRSFTGNNSPPVIPVVPNRRRKLTLDDEINSKFELFPACIPPKTINYPQISTRHVYGPWITSFNSISFRGKIEYEQDDSLVPENFLIPTNFGQFGDFTLSQTSGLEGLNLAAQGRANSIDQFSLFAVEEGSFTMPGPPNIKRIGDGLYGLPQITDIKINVSSDKIETSYSFKTISPRFNRINRDFERNLTKMSNKIKKIKMR